jgi:integrase
MIMAKTRRQFGYVRKLPSGRRQASYIGPDMDRHYAPFTFDAVIDAEAWLLDERRMIESGKWIARSRRAAELEASLPPTLRNYAGGWLRSRTVKGRPLKDRTRDHYRDLLERLIFPPLGELRLTAITAPVVRNWYTDVGPGRPTQRKHAYGLLKTIMGTALDEELIDKQPCTIRGANGGKRKHQPRIATVEELDVIVEHMPDRLRLAVLIAFWCGLRFGELAELRRSDIDLKECLIRVRRGVTRVTGEAPIVGTTKNDDARDVDFPPHLLPAFRHHLAEYVPDLPRDALLFAGEVSGQQLAPSTLYGSFYPARAGRRPARPALARSAPCGDDLRGRSARNVAGRPHGTPRTQDAQRRNAIPARRERQRQDHRRSTLADGGADRHARRQMTGK